MSEPTPGEVSRALDRFRADVHDDFDDLRRDMREGLAGVKSRIIFSDVYDADERRRQDELQTLRDMLTTTAATWAASLQTATDAWDRERKAAKEWREQRDRNRKWLISAVLLPIGGVIVELINLVRSAH